MSKTVLRAFTKWAMVLLCLSLLLGIAGWVASPAHAASRPAVTAQVVHHAPVRHSRPYCAPSSRTPNGCYDCSWSSIASNSGWYHNSQYGSNSYYKSVTVYAQYSNYDGHYCGYIAVQGALEQPPHQQVSSLYGAIYGGCGSSCPSGLTWVSPNAYWTWWYTPWASTTYYNYNSCIAGLVYYLQLPGTFTSCVYV